MCSCDTRPLRIRVHAPEGRVVLTEGRAGRGWPSPKKAGDCEETIEPPKDDGSELARQMRESSPELFKSHHYTSVEYGLHLMTNDEDRVKTASQYIYGNGCTGK